METNQVQKLDDDTFEATVEKGVTLVDFWAPWCMPCQMQLPILNEVAGEIGDRAKICKINVDEYRDAAFKYGISSIPTILLFRDGEMKTPMVGVQDKETLIQSIQSLLKEN